jgi:bifunctional DNA-binding transcriptional regulator/antitoxin component of YhaV-PrlF toxin-antitoxin module
MKVNQTVYAGKKRSGKKRIKVSEKRQITIPIDFYKALRLEDEVDCQLHGDAIVIRPVQEHSGEFDEQILAELINKGYSGKELLNKFKETRRRIKPAIKSLINEAELAAEGKANYLTYEDIFETADKNE